jgi:hypothetical protein
MRRTIWTSTILASALLGLAAMPWPSTRSFAEGALAVGMPGNDPSNGFRYAANSDRSREDAKDDAMTRCRDSKYPKTGKACRLIEVFHDQCVAVAYNGNPTTPSTAVGWGIAADSRTANDRAQTMCETMRHGRGRECKLDGDATCDGDAR